MIFRVSIPQGTAVVSIDPSFQLQPVDFGYPAHGERNIARSVWSSIENRLPSSELLKALLAMRSSPGGIFAVLVRCELGAGAEAVAAGDGARQHGGCPRRARYSLADGAWGPENDRARGEAQER